MAAAAKKRAAAKKTAPKTPARKAASSRKASAGAKSKPAKAAAKPAKPFSGPFAPVVSLKHLAEWTSAAYEVPKRQAAEMLAHLVANIGQALKKGSKVRIPDLGILQVRVRPARPARMGRNPATGEAIKIKASKATKRIAFRAAKTLKQSV